MLKLAMTVLPRSVLRNSRFAFAVLMWGILTTKPIRAQRSAGSAMAALQAAVVHHPQDADAWYELGCLQGRLHDFAAAEGSLRRAVALGPMLPEAHYQLGLTLVGNPKAKLDWPSAIAEFRIALKLRPAYAEALDYLGVGLTATGRNEEAVHTLAQAVQVAPGLASAHFNLGLALESAGRDGEAVPEYRKAAALRTSFPEAHSALGKLLFRMGNRSAAEIELRSALREDPDLQDAHYGLSQVLRAAGNIDDAKAEAEIALALGEREPDGIAASNLSNAALQEAANGSIAKAESMLREAILLRPDYGVPHYNLGLILADQQKSDAAVSELAQATALMPGEAKPWFDLGRVLRLQGRLADARACVAWAALLSPGDSRVAAELRSLLSSPSEPPGADESVSASANGQPRFGVQDDTADSYSRYADQLRAEGDTPGEIGERLRSLAEAPVSVKERLLLAAAYQRASSPQKALQEYRKVLLVVPSDVAAKLGLSQLSGAEGKR